MKYLTPLIVCLFYLPFVSAQSTIVVTFSDCPAGTFIYHQEGTDEGGRPYYVVINPEAVGEIYYDLFEWAMVIQTTENNGLNFRVVTESLVPPCDPEAWSLIAFNPEECTNSEEILEMYCTEDIPTLSQWGQIILGLSLLILGSVLLKSKIWHSKEINSV